MILECVSAQIEVREVGKFIVWPLFINRLEDQSALLAEQNAFLFVEKHLQECFLLNIFLDQFNDVETLVDGLFPILE